MLALLLLAAIPGAALSRLCTLFDPRWLLGYCGLISLVTWLLYWRDKKKAVAGEWRIPESTLQLAELAGGWPAAFLAQRAFRHKIAKRSYQISFWLIVLLHEYVACDYLVQWRLARGAFRLVQQIAPS